MHALKPPRDLFVSVFRNCILALVLESMKMVIHFGRFLNVDLFTRSFTGKNKF